MKEQRIEQLVQGWEQEVARLSEYLKASDSELEFAVMEASRDRLAQCVCEIKEMVLQREVDDGNG